jgi:hypothetical protein
VTGRAGSNILLLRSKVAGGGTPWWFSGWSKEQGLVVLLDQSIRLGRPSISKVTGAGSIRRWRLSLTVKRHREGSLYRVRSLWH